jgi:hypothetical protein
VRALILLLLPSLAWAQDTNADIARRHVAAGTEHYRSEQWLDALTQFEAAQRMHSDPAVELQIAHCHEKLEQFPEAIAAYQRYLQGVPNAPEAADLRAHIERLRQQRSRPPPPDPERPPPEPTADPNAQPGARELPGVESPQRRWLAPSIVAGLGVASFVVGAALLGSVSSDFNVYDGPGGCRPCERDVVAELQMRAYGGYAMLAIMGVAIVVDIPLWMNASRRRY